MTEQNQQSMNYYPAKSNKWDLFDQYQLKTILNMGQVHSYSSIIEEKREIKKHRYKIADKTESFPKDMLVILPSNYEKRQCNELEPKYQSSKQKNNVHVDSLPKIQARDGQQISQKCAPIHHKDGKPKNRRVLHRVESKQALEVSKYPPLQSKIKRLNPHSNEKYLNIQKGEEEVKQIDISWHLTHNARGTKDVLKFKNRLNVNSKGRILCKAQNKQYRLGEEKHLCHMFKINSFDPGTEKQVSNKKLQQYIRQNRRSTQPNLETEQFIDKKSNPNMSLDNCLQARTIDKKYKKQQHISPQKVSKSKFKSTMHDENPKKILKRKSKTFIVPFVTFYYRNFLWKINFSNNLFIESPVQYEHRLKVYIGKGNNYYMIRGLISRRYWFAFTERLEQANFVWTQLKNLDYFKNQKPSQIHVKKTQYDGQYVNNSILSLSDQRKYRGYWEKSVKLEEKSDQRLLPRQRYFKYQTFIKSDELKPGKMHNHLKNNYVIGNKKALLKTMCHYYSKMGKNPFDYLPLTFHIAQGVEDQPFLDFMRYYHKRNREIKKSGQQKHNIWILKPGQNSNRGYGIKVCHDLKEIKTIIKNKQKWNDGTNKTYIIQEYIQKPLLYKRRKIDIRHYILITCINGHRKGYWYADGCIRTSSLQYKLNMQSQSIHLTNDAIQKYLPDYGKYEKGNKLSYEQLDNYIKKNYEGKDFYHDVYPEMKNRAIDIIRASINYLDPDRLENNFQVFGLDFMIDSELKLWLIEVNSNPCLQLSCPLLSQIIPNLIENVLEVTLDAMYPPPIRYSPKMPRYMANMQDLNKLELVFDSRIEEGITGDPSIIDNRMLVQQEDVFQNDGSEWEDN